VIFVKLNLTIDVIILCSVCGPNIIALVLRSRNRRINIAQRQKTT